MGNLSGKQHPNLEKQWQPTVGSACIAFMVGAGSRDGLQALIATIVGVMVLVQVKVVGMLMVSALE